jgi:hypothetical protein
MSWGHHYRCYRSKATERFLMLPKRGIEFVDLRGKAHMRHDWLRAPCVDGTLPANGLVHVAPHQCVCCQGVQLSNFNALAPGAELRTSGEAAPAPVAPRLQKGPAYADSPNRQSPIGNRQSEDWPTYRHDAKRSGVATILMPEAVTNRWHVRLRGRLTPPVVAAGQLIVAENDVHTIHVLDAETGAALWHYTAGGRIVSPPTIYETTVLFGSADGRVSCLGAK